MKVSKWEVYFYGAIMPKPQLIKINNLAKHIHIYLFNYIEHQPTSKSAIGKHAQSKYIFPTLPILNKSTVITLVKWGKMY